jgi:hypothetical protein
MSAAMRYSADVALLMPEGYQECPWPTVVSAEPEEAAYIRKY